MKRNISVASILGAIVLIFLSLERVTTVGLYEGKCTIYQTVSSSGKIYELVSNGIKINNVLFVILFFVGISLLFVPGFILFNQSRGRSIASIVLNVIGTIFIFILFNSCQYMYMLILVSLLITSNIFIRMIESYKSGFDWFIAVVTALICFVNVYYLLSHLRMWQFWDSGISNGNLDNVIEEMISISKINMFCFGLWIIPCIILFCKDFICKKKS